MTSESSTGFMYGVDWNNLGCIHTADGSIEYPIEVIDFSQESVIKWHIAIRMIPPENWSVPCVIS